jgi:hypothetical protein
MTSANHQRRPLNRRGAPPRQLLSRVLRFRLRSFLIAIAVLAVGCGLVHRKLHERAVIAQLTELGCPILYDYELDAEGRYDAEARCPPGGPLLRKVLGDDFWATPKVAWFQCGNGPGHRIVQTLKLLKQLPTVKEVWLDGGFDSALERWIQQTLPNAAIEQVEST